MKKLLLALSVATLLLSCVKEIHTEKVTVLPDPAGEKTPQPVVSLLKEYTSSFKLFDLLYKTDPSTGNTFLEAFDTKNIGGPEEPVHSTIGYFQCVGKDGGVKWDKWIPVTSLYSKEYSNKTVFDITSDGGVIDCFNVKDFTTGAQLPYIQKLTAGGQVLWGEEGKLFYTFGQDLSEDVAPVEGFVAADSNGGAWVAAGNTPEPVVVARVDGEGNRTTEMNVFDSEGTLGKREYVSRPQMISGSDNSVFLLLQYADFDSASSIYQGYYDLVKISADGVILSEQTLMPEKSFTRGISAKICPDGEGGAYVIFVAVKDNRHHAFVEHFNRDGNVDFPEVDLTPDGFLGDEVHASAAVDPESKDCVVVMMDNTNVKSYILAQTVDLQGKVLLGEDSNPLLLFETENFTYIEDSYGFNLLYSPTDGKIHLYYVYTKGQRYPLMKTHTISTRGELSEARNVVDLDVKMISDGFDDSRIEIIDGKLRFWWFKSKTFNYYSFTDTLQ